MSRLVWLVLGLMGGIAVSRNAPAMSAPAASAVILCGVVACGFVWWAAYRGKSQAVASAVAVAVAQAHAEAEAVADARAAAVAQSAVNLFLTEEGQVPLSGREASAVMPRIVREAVHAAGDAQAERASEAHGRHSGVVDGVVVDRVR